MVINYIDDTFQNSDNLDDEDFYKVVISNINLVLLIVNNDPLMTSINTFVLIWMCDCVLQESAKIVKLAGNLRRLATTAKSRFRKVYLCCFHHRAQVLCGKVFLHH
jgi:hypothetical protein